MASEWQREDRPSTALKRLFAALSRIAALHTEARSPRYRRPQRILVSAISDGIAMATVAQPSPSFLRGR